jgi:hypothetical protein
MYNQFATPYVDYLASEFAHPGSKVAVNGMMFSKSTIDSIQIDTYSGRFRITCIAQT